MKTLNRIMLATLPLLAGHTLAEEVVVPVVPTETTAVTQGQTQLRRGVDGCEIALPVMRTVKRQDMDNSYDQGRSQGASSGGQDRSSGCNMNGMNMMSGMSGVMNMMGGMGGMGGIMGIMGGGQGKGGGQGGSGRGC